MKETFYVWKDNIAGKTQDYGRGFEDGVKWAFELIKMNCPTPCTRSKRSHKSASSVKPK